MPKQIHGEIFLMAAEEDYFANGRRQRQKKLNDDWERTESEHPRCFLWTART